MGGLVSAPGSKDCRRVLLRILLIMRMPSITYIQLVSLSHVTGTLMEESLYSGWIVYVASAAKCSHRELRERIL